MFHNTQTSCLRLLGDGHGCECIWERRGEVEIEWVVNVGFAPAFCIQIHRDVAARNVLLDSSMVCKVGE